METLPKIFTSQAPTKSQINEGVQKVIGLVNDGEVCPIQVATSLKALETAIKAIKDGIYEAIENEAAKEPEKTFERNGHSYNVRNSSRYDYSDCGDPVLTKLTEKVDITTEERKDRETLLKALKKPLNVVDDDTGEIVEVYPPAKLSKTVVAITLAR
ncbi:MAG TPA: hypothetical protein ENH82_08210 [bacterium]|nr:hypothetical protein [bacterium]